MRRIERNARASRKRRPSTENASASARCSRAASVASPVTHSTFVRITYRALHLTSHRGRERVDSKEVDSERRRQKSPRSFRGSIFVHPGSSPLPSNARVSRSGARAALCRTRSARRSASTHIASSSSRPAAAAAAASAGSEDSNASRLSAVGGAPPRRASVARTVPPRRPTRGFYASRASVSSASVPRRRGSIASRVPSRARGVPRRTARRANRRRV